MSVVRVSELYQDRDGRALEDGSVEYTRSFQVETDNPNDGPNTVTNAAGIPKRFETYYSGNDSNPYATCREIEATPVDGTRILWEVRARYSTRIDFTSGTGTSDPNPLNRAPIIRWGATFVSKPATKGYLVNATTGIAATTKTGIVNSAKRPFDPPAEMDDARPTLHITKNFADFNPTVAYDYIGSVNNDPWLGATARQWKCMNISASSQVEEVNKLPFLYWTREYEFHYRPETWDLVLLDQGFAYIQGGVYKKVIDDEGQPSSEPANLDGAGGLLGVGTEPKFVTYRVYPEKSFLQLGLV